MEALEQARHFFERYPSAGVSHGEFGHRATVRRLQTHYDLAFEGELKSVRDEVEHYLLPHIAIDEYGMRQRRAIDDQIESRFFGGGTKARRKIGGEGGDVRGFVAGLHAAGFYARKIEQTVNQLEQSEPVSVGHRYQCPVIRAV